MGTPSTASVAKKAKFFDSRGLGLSESADLDRGSDSPVSELLSTCKRLEIIFLFLRFCCFATTSLTHYCGESSDGVFNKKQYC